MPAQLLDLGGDGPDAVLLPANGFPLPAYRALCEVLGQTLRLRGFPLRPSWPEHTQVDRRIEWSTLGEDLISVLEAAGAPQIVIGHSMGATSAALAAAARPELFAALVVIEPAMANRWLRLAIALTPYAFRQRFNPAAATLRRKDRWPDRAAFLAHAARNPTYRSLSDAARERLADGLLRDCAEGVELAYSKAWEAHFYTNPPYPMGAFRRVRCPFVGIRGAPSIFLSASLWSEIESAQPEGQFRTLPSYGHLLPIEAPEVCAEAVLTSLGAAGVLT